MVTILILSLENLYLVLFCINIIYLFQVGITANAIVINILFGVCITNYINYCTSVDYSSEHN